MQKKLKRNPIDDMYTHLLIDGYLTGDPYYLPDIIIYEKQGFACGDCDEIYDKCECEWCENCQFRRCLCNLGITYKNAFSEKTAKPKNSTKKKVRDEILRLVNQKLYESEKEYFYKRINENK